MSFKFNKNYYKNLNMRFDPFELKSKGNGNGLSELLKYLKEIDLISLHIEKNLYLKNTVKLSKTGYTLFDDYTKEELTDFVKKAKDEYNTTVSFVINLQDINMVSDIAKEAENGNLAGRMQSLFEILNLKKAGTICLNDIALKKVDETAALKLLEFFNKNGVDVISNGYCSYSKLYNENIASHIPFFFELLSDIFKYMKTPVYKLSSAYYGKSNGFNLALGESVNAEEIILKSRNFKDDFFKDFYTKFIKYIYLNSLERLSANVTKNTFDMIYSKNTVSSYLENKVLINNVVAKLNDEMLLPTDWYDTGTAVVYTSKGGEVDWNVSRVLGYASTQNIVLTEITGDGLSFKKRLLKLNNGMLQLNLDENKPAAFLIARL